MNDFVYWFGAFSMGLSGLICMGLAIAYMLDVWWKAFCKFRCATFLYEAISEWRERHPDRSDKANWWRDKL